MRKLEGVVKEIVDEMAYLKRREGRFRDTNGASHSPSPTAHTRLMSYVDLGRVYEDACAEFCLVHHCLLDCIRRLADLPFAGFLPEEIPNRLSGGVSASTLDLWCLYVRRYLGDGSSLQSNGNNEGAWITENGPVSSNCSAFLIARHIQRCLAALLNISWQRIDICSGHCQALLITPEPTRSRTTHLDADLLFLTTTINMRWSLYLRAVSWRLLGRFGHWLGRFRQPRPLPPLFSRSIPATLGPAGNIKLTFYTPPSYNTRTTETFPIVITFHGGGWTMGSATDDARWNTVVVKQTGAIACGVDYRLAPEFPFPIPVQDAADAIMWIYKNADELGIDRSRLALSGFSAGGNLALAASLLLNEHGESVKEMIKAIVAFYPVTDFSDHQRRVKATKRPQLRIAAGLVALFDDSYLYPRDQIDLSHPYLSPLKATDDQLNQGMPRHLDVFTCEFDSLVAEGELFAARVKALSNSRTVEYTMIEGVRHGWDHYPNPPDDEERKITCMYNTAANRLSVIFSAV